jgi:WD40 repeat protein/serine/threonine protein kinase
MSKKSVFDLDPEQLNQLLSIGKKDAGPVPEEQSSSSSVESKANPTASLNVFMEKSGDKIGRYKLLNVLGEGGMGIVYLAEQERPIKRRVALKVIKPGMDSKRVVARFEAERQALALLDHPNIAHVHDAGTTEAGRPYFVMEYVKGLPITEYCDQHKLTIEDRLNLFRQVCLAVNHAHQKGIIHRDIKPSNILVSTQDDQAVPKIIDFGVAKALSMPLTDRTLATEDNQLLGTPEYMSPEQADMASEDIDTRSDVYSLGVLLYILLTGVLPFDPGTLRTGGIEHIRKVIRETDPKTPSTRLTKLGEEGKMVAEKRRTEVAVLAKCLHRELEWIPLKAMRKERAERYRSASELADDIENYLKGEPLIAGPLTTGYRLQKFVQRNKGIFVAVITVAAALVIGLTVSAISLVFEQQARRQAQAKELEMRRIAYASDMSLAQQALAMNDMGRARQLLEAHRPAPGEVDLRGWEWRYLRQECHSDAIGELCDYDPSSATSVAYSPDGRVLVVATSWPGFVEIWDVPGRKLIKNLQPEEGFDMAFSPRGDLLATTAGDQIRFWRIGTWERVDEGQLTLGRSVRALKFSPDGTRLAGLSFEGELALWEISQWPVVRQIDGGNLSVPRFGDLDFSPDGKALVIGDANDYLQVIDLTSGDTKFDVSDAHSEGIHSVAWSPNGSVIASGSAWDGGPIKLWDAVSGKPLGELEGHTSWISDMVFSKDGMRLYSASGDETIRIWDVGYQRPLAILRGSSDEVAGLALSPDGTTLASACKDGVVAFWSAIPQPKEDWPIPIPLSRSARPAFAPDSRVLAVPRTRGVSLLDLDTSKEIEQITELGDDVEVVTYSPSGTQLVSGSRGGEIRVWSCVECRLLRELDGHKGPLALLRFRTDGTRLLSLDMTGKLIWWDVHTWQAVKSLVVELPAKWHIDQRWLPVDISPDGRLLACGTAMGTMHWLDGETGDLMATSTGGDQGTTQVAFSCDGLRLASTSVFGTVTLWDPSTFGSVTSFRAHLLGAQGVTFSPDGRRLATGGGTSRDAVKLWDLSTLRELITLPGQRDIHKYVAFSNDGRWMAACGRNVGKLYLWHAPSWEAIEAEEKRLKSKQSP